MTLRSIYIGSDDLTFSTEFNSVFWYNTEFINNWMSRNVRKLKIPTEGFNHVSVFVSLNEDSCSLSNFLQVKLHWTNSFVEKFLATKNEHERTRIYLDALREGLIRASKLYDIHIDELLGLVDEFQKNDCKNEWQLRSMILNEWNVRLKFTCHLTINDFRLVLTLFNKKKDLIAQKVVFRVYPDKVFWGRKIRKVIATENMLYVDDFLDKHFLSFDLNELRNGIIEEILLDEEIKKYLYEANVEKYNKIQWKM